jgi:hypothetical protein
MTEYLWMFVAMSVVNGELQHTCKVYATENKCKVGSEDVMNSFGGDVVISTQCFPIKPSGNKYDGWASLCRKFADDFQKELRKN